MCGLCGFCGGGEGALVLQMADALAHRGPDGEGFYHAAADGVHLGHRRLAVLDPASGAQPMANEDRTIQVVFNGEIYNHRELRRALERCGHRFRSDDHSDTEVLVHGYEEWGEALPGKLNGMFAFAVWEATSRRLFLARDRFGKKPLYYVHGPGFFAFASEIRALMVHPEVDDRLDPLALKKYFAHGFIPAPRTPYLAVRKLPGGCWMAFDLATSRLTIQSYWQFCIEPRDPPTVREEESLREELLALLAASVGRRLESDAPLGFLLSGGVDSAAVLALAARRLPPGQLNSFSLGFDDPSFDESAPARFMAERVGSGHRTQEVSLASALADLPELLRRWDEPIGDSSILPTFMVCRFARESVTVALTGDGGDELFAGYDPFRALTASGWLHRLQPLGLPALLHRVSALLPLSDRNMSLDFKLRRWLRGASQRPALWNPVWMGALSCPEVAELFGEATTEEELYEEALGAWEACASPSPIDRSLEFYTRFYLQDDILTKIDRASMLVSLELRSPFLDNEVVDFAARLSHRCKFRGGRGKWLLKRALAGVLPEEVLHRPKKGFGMPLSRWLRELPRPEPGRDGEWMDTAWLVRHWEDHRAKRADHRLLLWSWMVMNAFLAATARSQKPWSDQRSRLGVR